MGKAVIDMLTKVKYLLNEKMRSYRSLYEVVESESVSSSEIKKSDNATCTIIKL